MSIAATEQVFSATAATYDPARARLIPCFDRFYEAAVEAVPDAAETVLDLGAGTGLLSAFVRQRLPHVRLHLIDNSDPMLSQARSRFAGAYGIRFELADYTLAPLPLSRYCAIVSALSIHHLEDDAKRMVFSRILSALKPGGVFINAEQILQPTPEAENAAREQWLVDVRALGATEQQIADSLRRQQEDRCATIDDQLAWLSAAGFCSARCVFADGRFAVLTAVAPATGQGGLLT